MRCSKIRLGAKRRGAELGKQEARFARHARPGQNRGGYRRQSYRAAPLREPWTDPVAEASDAEESARCLASGVGEGRRSVCPVAIEGSDVGTLLYEYSSPRTVFTPAPVLDGDGVREIGADSGSSTLGGGAVLSVSIWFVSLASFPISSSPTSKQ